MKQLSFTCDTNMVAEDEATGSSHEADGHDSGRQATAIAVTICRLQPSSCHRTADYSRTGTLLILAQGQSLQVFCSLGWAFGSKACTWIYAHEGASHTCIYIVLCSASFGCWLSVFDMSPAVVDFASQAHAIISTQASMVIWYMMMVVL
jgi:hypothetical protein